MTSILSLKTCFDEIEETNAEDELKEWMNIALDAKIELAKFVESHQGVRKVTEYVGFLKGSFNIAFRYRFNQGPDIIIRFPKPGFTATALRDEKVANEVQIMQYIRQKTTIPIPRIHHWGLTKESPLQLGPFIIMDYVEGIPLSTFLKVPTEDDQADLVLNPDIDDTTISAIYRQISNFLIQLSRLSFNRIGAISINEAGEATVNKRPLTYGMNELIALSGFPMDRLPASPFDSTSEYLHALSEDHLHHPWTQRNIADDKPSAQARLIARHAFAKLIPQYSMPDTGRFTLFCDDLRPANMLVDPVTLKITAVIDWEFTDPMPPQFSMDPPWWLLLEGPERWLDRDALDEFLTLYKPRLEQFLAAMEEEEAKLGGQAVLPEGRLSILMRDSWRSGRFWFDYAVRKSFEMDVVYWLTLHHTCGDGRSLADMGGDVDAATGEFLEHKMRQLEAYNEECAARFS